MIARMRTIEAAATTTAPPAAVWALLADASKWQQWGRVVEGRDRKAAAA